MLSYKIVVLVMVFLHRHRTLIETLSLGLDCKNYSPAYLAQQLSPTKRKIPFIPIVFIVINQEHMAHTAKSGCSWNGDCHLYFPLSYKLFYVLWVENFFIVSFYKRLKLHWAASCLETPFLVPFCTRLFLIFSSTSFGSNITCAIFLSSLKLCILYFFSHVCSF